MEKRNTIIFLFFIIIACLLLMALIFLIDSNNKVIKISSANLESGANVEIKENQIISFEFEEDEYSISPKINEEEYLEIVIMNQSFILLLNVEESIDLDKDGNYDFKIKFTKLEGINYINILKLTNQTFEEEEEINEEDREETEEINEEDREETEEINEDYLNDEPESPSNNINEEEIRICIDGIINETLNQFIENNGYINNQPQYSLNYNGEEIPYYCYTSQDRQRCIVQEPNLINFFESEINENIKNNVINCYPEHMEIINNSIYEIKLTETNEGENRNQIDSIYRLSIIIQQIISQETRYCNADYLEIVETYDWIKITKYVTQESDKIYTVTDNENGDEIKFAIRNCVIS